MKRVISAVQPTGNITIGNYLGAINNWKVFQDKYECFFSVVDLHSLTAGVTDPNILRENTYKALAVYIASGIDPEKSVLFKQSSVSSHSELFWILSCFTQMGKLNRMTQFKDKAGKNKEKASLALYAYPVLMAADILLYDADIIPVGEDQLQHLELANDIVRSFNSRYSIEHFKRIEPYLLKSTKRVMSLRDGSKKMSKSDPSDMSRINLTDDKALIQKKIMKAKTDDVLGFGDLENRLEMRNLVAIFASFSDKSEEEIAGYYDSLGNKQFKTDLSELLIDKISPIANEVTRLLADKGFLDNVFANGAEKAKIVAEKNMQRVRSLIGIS